MLEFIKGVLSSEPTLFNSKGYSQLKKNLAVAEKENEILRSSGYTDHIDSDGYRRWTRKNGSPVDRTAALSEVGISGNPPLKGIILPKKLRKVVRIGE